MRKGFWVFLVLAIVAGWAASGKRPGDVARRAEAFAISQYGKLIQPARPERKPLAARLEEQGLRAGSPAFIRIFKEESTLEVWLRDAGGWRLFESFAICRWSGALGPKLREGDLQSPEGMYRVTLDRLNPASRYHLAMNVGYPNSFDQANGRSGSFIMIHGNCVSIGCFAMTDDGIDDIYALTEAALKAGQGGVAVHIFPFRMTDANLARHAASPWMEFWRDLKAVHDRFEASREVPEVAVRQARYVVR